MAPRPSPRRERIDVQLLEPMAGAERQPFTVDLDWPLLCIVDGTLKIEPDGTASLVSFTMRTDGPGGADINITATMLRQTNIPRIVQAAQRAVSRRAMQVVNQFDPDRDAVVIAEVEKALRAHIKAASRRRPPEGVRGRGDAFYRRIALDLIELVESGRPTPGGVLETLAKIEERRLRVQVPVQTLRTWLAVARDRKFLAPGERGRLVALPGRRLYDTNGELDG